MRTGLYDTCHSNRCCITMILVANVARKSTKITNYKLQTALQLCVQWIELLLSLEAWIGLFRVKDFVFGYIRIILFVFIDTVPMVMAIFRVCFNVPMLVDGLCIIGNKPNSRVKVWKGKWRNFSEKIVPFHTLIIWNFLYSNASTRGEIFVASIQSILCHKFNSFHFRLRGRAKRDDNNHEMSAMYSIHTHTERKKRILLSSP